MTFATSDMKAYKRNHYEANKDYYKAKSRARKERLRYELLAVILSHLEANPCVDCGNANVEILEFDHREGAEKEFNVSDAMTRQVSVERLRTEIAKCDVRCPNCHRRMTLNRSGRGERDWRLIEAGLRRADKAERPSIGQTSGDSREATLCLAGLAESSDSLGLSDLDVEYWRQATSRGVFPYLVLNGKKRVRLSDFEAWTAKLSEDTQMNEPQIRDWIESTVRSLERKRLDA